MSDKYDDLSPVIDDYVAPVRADIRKALMDVSNFTLKEISVLGWSALYKAHSLIVKYGQTDVEEDFSGSSTSFKTTKNPLSSVNSGFFRKNNSCSVFLQFFFPANFKFFQYFSIIFTKFIW